MKKHLPHRAWLSALEAGDQVTRTSRSQHSTSRGFRWDFSYPFLAVLLLFDVAAALFPSRLKTCFSLSGPSGCQWPPWDVQTAVFCFDAAYLSLLHAHLGALPNSAESGRKEMSKSYQEWNSIETSGLLESVSKLQSPWLAGGRVIFKKKKKSGPKKGEKHLLFCKLTMWKQLAGFYVLSLIWAEAFFSLDRFAQAGDKVTKKSLSYWENWYGCSGWVCHFGVTVWQADSFQESLDSKFNLKVNTVSFTQLTYQ